MPVTIRRPGPGWLRPILVIWPDNITAPAALRAIDQLVSAGVLAKVPGRQRGRRYSASEVLAALDAFAARAGRRGGY